MKAHWQPKLPYAGIKDEILFHSKYAQMKYGAKENEKQKQQQQKYLIDRRVAFAVSATILLLLLLLYFIFPIFCV